MVPRTLGRTVARLGADPDADLLRRFLTTGDEAAFAALVRRHGPMVFGVCRRTLGHAQDAEDAFQAVFLILARKAHTVRADGVGRWLYGVAVRVANKARVRRARVRSVSADLSAVPARPAPDPADWRPHLDAALERLPARYRDPVVLCDLLGRSRAEAAAELGVSEGTLSSRLARARDRLRARLARVGATLSVPALAAGLSDEATALVPASLLTSTAAAGPSAAARELAHGVLRAMFLTKVLKLTAAVVGLAGVVTVGATWTPTAGQDPPPASKGGGPPVEVAKPAPKDPPPDPAGRLRELQVERVAALKEQLDGQFERVKIGKDPVIQYLVVVQELGEAELEIARTKEERVAAAERMVQELKVGEEQLIILHKAGLQTKQGVAQAKAARLKAEIKLEKLKAAK